MNDKDAYFKKQEEVEKYEWDKEAVSAIESAERKIKEIWETNKKHLSGMTQLGSNYYFGDVLVWGNNKAESFSQKEVYIADKVRESLQKGNFKTNKKGSPVVFIDII